MSARHKSRLGPSWRKYFISQTPCQLTRTNREIKNINGSASCRASSRIPFTYPFNIDGCYFVALTVYTCMQIRVRPTHNLAQHGVCVICAKLLLMLVCVCVCAWPGKWFYYELSCAQNLRTLLAAACAGEFIKYKIYYNTNNRRYNLSLNLKLKSDDKYIINIFNIFINSFAIWHSIE